MAEKGGGIARIHIVISAVIIVLSGILTGLMYVTH
jgi:hypothetical protein